MFECKLFPDKKSQYEEVSKGMLSLKVEWHVKQLWYQDAVCMDCLQIWTASIILSMSKDSYSKMVTGGQKKSD